MTFEEVSIPYLNAFGEPDLSFDFPLENNICKQWYWYKSDVVVEFVAPLKDRKKGWDLSFAISLDPLKHYMNNK
jgi:hypothetical protein